MDWILVPFLILGWVLTVLFFILWLLNRGISAQLKNQVQIERELRLEQSRDFSETREYLTSVLPRKTLELLESKEHSSTSQQIQVLQQHLSPVLREISQLNQTMHSRQKDEAFFKGGLERELQNLVNLNQTLSEEAHNLARALEGQNKSQGIWGEMVLERLLESAGLEAGRDFELQKSFRLGGGTVLRPDVVITLPKERFLVIDAKVSLKSYMDVIAASQEVERAAATKRLVGSIRGHIKSLGEKHYELLHKSSSIEAVLLFMPIEGALAAALSSDSGILEYAFSKRIIICSPSSLLLTIKIVNTLWLQDSKDGRTEALLELSDELTRSLKRLFEDLQNLDSKLTASQDLVDRMLTRFTAKRGGLLPTLDSIAKKRDQ